MSRFQQFYRGYCKLVSKSVSTKLLTNNGKAGKIDFQHLIHPSKVPCEPIEQHNESHKFKEGFEIDSKTIQLLERLSLVDLDSKAALETLKSSIQFADKIAHINTDEVPPLYSVLEEENLYLRKDRVTEGDCRAEILQNSKVTDEDYFVSPPGNIPLEQEERKLEDF